jgi:uncharacterized protein
MAKVAKAKAATAITRRQAAKWLGSALLLTSAPSRGRAAGNSDRAKRKVLFFSKSSGFEHDPVKSKGGHRSLAETILRKIKGFDIVATKDGRIFDGDLAAYDAFLFFTTGNLLEAGTDGAPPMSARGKEALLAAIRDGKGFIGVHSASDTFHSSGDRFESQQQVDPYIAMLGGEFISHGSQQQAQVKVVDQKFPGLRGLGENFSLKEEWYSLKNFAADIHVLLVLETGGMHDPEYKRPPFPIAWARREGKGRVYYNALGHRHDVWASARFQAMLTGALSWATGGEPAELAANLSEVAPQAAVLPPHH